jgi:hypothetical protein
LEIPVQSRSSDSNNLDKYYIDGKHDLVFSGWKNLQSLSAATESVPLDGILLGSSTFSNLTVLSVSSQEVHVHKYFDANSIEICEPLVKQLIDNILQNLEIK